MIASPYYERKIDRDKNLHYNIKKETPISYQHLVSVILYTDWSKLSKEFTNTFRKTASYESISSLKERNREFAIWSKYLRETVEIFGYNAVGEGRGFDHNKWINKLAGPFYCGMNQQMVLPEYDIRLCGPTSTSMCIEVATNFAGRRGIIIRLNNTGSGYVNHVTSFGCKWLSNHAGEEEWLFIGGQHTVKIESIRIIQTAQSFSDFFKALFHFDCMLNATKLKYMRTQSKNDRYILQNLLNHILKVNGFQNTYPQYINDTFEAYANHKKTIVIDVPFVVENFGNLTPLIITHVPSTGDIMIQSVLFDLFKNMNKMLIKLGETKDENKFSLIELNAIMSKLNKQQLIAEKRGQQIIVTNKNASGEDNTTLLEEQITNSKYKILTRGRLTRKAAVVVIKQKGIYKSAKDIKQKKQKKQKIEQMALQNLIDKQIKEERKLINN
eukprot:1093_1